MSTCHLQPLTAVHLAEVQALLDDPDVNRFTRFPTPPAPQFVQEWFDRYQRGRIDGTKEAFAFLDEKGGFLGLALAVDIDHDEGEVELGYVVAPAARGRGVASDLLGQLTDWTFRETGAQRIRLVIDVLNTGSQRAAARAGYVQEGVMRSVAFKEGKRNDAQLWSKLPSDPAPLASRR